MPSITTTDYAFSTDLTAKVLRHRTDYLEWEVTSKQFEDIQSLCSGNPIPCSFSSALEWAQARSEFLKGEAQGYEKAGFGYQIPEYCRYGCSDQGVGYETTRGTVFMVFNEPFNPGVLLPKDRMLGYHHQIISLVVSGITLKSLNEGLNLHRFEGDELKRVCADRLAWDEVLVPLGFPPQKTYEQIIQERSERWQPKVPLADEDSTDYEDYDYEDYGTDEDYVV